MNGWIAVKGALTLLLLAPAHCSGDCNCPDEDCGSCDCTQEPEVPGDGEADAGFQPDLAGCIPTDPAAAAPEMYAAILERLTTEVPVNEGDWGEDFGDATAYAPPALLEAGVRLCEARYLTMADETLKHTRFLIDHFVEILQGGQPDELLVAILGPIEAYGIIPYGGWAADADEGLGWLNDTAELFGDYLYGPGVDTSPYGPTAVTAIVASENLRYVLLVDPADEAKAGRAFEIAGQIDFYAWDAAGGFYKPSPDDTRLDLYPNVAMMILWTLAYSRTGQAEQLQKARDLFDAVAPLKLADLGAYHSMYSSSVPDYVSLSSQNYLMFGLYLLQAETGDRAYLDEALEVLGFVETHLFYNGMAWHHWENGERADWYCSGCNFQLLYVINLLSSAL